jgi:hypothetical protein
MGNHVPECPKLSKCPFFNDRMRNMPAVAEMVKNSYCRSTEHVTCARYLLASTPGNFEVPENLFPDQQSRVKSILKNPRR